MNIPKPINLQQWIAEHRELLKPPVGNQIIFDSNDYIVMVVSGPNQRTDFHINSTEELFFQLEGDIDLRMYVDETFETITIKQGELFLLPANIPHSPVRGINTTGLVIEKKRQMDETDYFCWFCSKCHCKIYQEPVILRDIVKQLPEVFERFYQSEINRTCKHCGTIFEKIIK